MTHRTFRAMIVAVLASALPLLAAGDWFENTQIGGDLRYRHERTDKEGSDVRNRHRVRARFGLKTAVNEEVKVEIRLATGAQAPYTSDQSLDDGFGSKDINLDRAYFDWQPEGIKGVNVFGGKMVNPFVTGRGLVWDGDVTPEGVAVKYAMGGESASLLARAGGFWVDERSSDDDTMVYGGQITAAINGSPVDLLVGVGVYAFDNMEGYGVIVDDEKGFGNRTRVVTDDAGETETLVYVNAYTEVEGFVEVGAKLGAVPCKVCGHYVVNTEADTDDTGYLVGARIGKAEDPGSLQLDYDWRELEADAVVGALADSNVWGGGTDGRGHRVYLTYQIAKRWQAGFEYFVSEIGLDDPIDYNKFRVELKAKF